MIDCFTVNKNIVTERLDPLFYHSRYIKADLKLKKSKYPLKTLREISKKIVDGPFGSQLKVEEYAERGIPLLRVKDVKEGKIIDNDFVFITPEKHEQLKRSKVFPRDVVLTKAGSIGNAAVFPERLKEANITSHLVKIEVKDGISPDYLSIFLNSDLGKTQIFRLGNKTTRPELNTNEVSSVQVAIPPLEVQNKVVEMMNEAYKQKKQKEEEIYKFLNSIDDYILDELGLTLSPSSKNITFRVYSSSLDGRIDPNYYKSKINEIHPSKKGYPVILLGDIIEDIYRYPTFYGIEYQKEGTRIIKGENIDEHGYIEPKQDFDYISDKVNSKFPRTQLSKGDLVFTVRGVIGKVGFFEDISIPTNISGNVIRINIKKEHSPRFVWSYLNSKIGQKIIQSLTSGQVQRTITVSDIKSIMITLPPLENQEIIAAEVMRRYDMARKLKEGVEGIIEKNKAKIENILLE